MVFAFGIAIIPLWDLLFLKQTTGPGFLNKTLFWWYIQNNQVNFLRYVDFGQFFYFINYLIFGFGFGSFIANLDQQFTDKEYLAKLTLIKQNNIVFLLVFVFISIMYILPLLLESLLFVTSYGVILAYYTPIFFAFLGFSYFSYSFCKEKNVTRKIIILISAGIGVFMILILTFLLIFMLGTFVSPPCQTC